MQLPSHLIKKKKKLKFLRTNFSSDFAWGYGIISRHYSVILELRLIHISENHFDSLFYSVIW